MLSSLWRHRYLVWQMTRREVVGRYRGSVLGVVWSFVLPLVMLAIYTFVFSFIFRARWTPESDSSGDFALFLFAGLVMHSMVADCVSRAPTLIVANPSYVKRVVFPLEVLPWVTMGAALIHTAISFAVLLLASLLVRGHLPWTALYLPIVIAPLVVLTVGAAWFLASVGTFVRDVGQIVGILTTILLFLSPIFYPASVLPKEIRPLLFLNPLTFIIEQVRDVALVGNQPAWARLFMYAVVSVVVARLGFMWFEKTRKGFSDVL